MTPSEEVLELLSAYLDSALSESERSALEARLHTEAELQSALNDLRATRTVLRSTPQLAAPRDFRLPRKYARRSARPNRMLFAFSAIAASLIFAVGFYYLFGRNLALTAQIPQHTATTANGVALLPTILPAANTATLFVIEADKTEETTLAGGALPATPVMKAQSTTLSGFSQMSPTETIPANSRIPASPIPVQSTIEMTNRYMEIGTATPMPTMMLAPTNAPAPIASGASGGAADSSATNDLMPPGVVPAPTNSAIILYATPTQTAQLQANEQGKTNMVELILILLLELLKGIFARR